MSSSIVRALGWGGVHPDGAALGDRLWERGRPGEVAEAIVEGIMAAQASGDRPSALGLRLQSRAGSDGHYPATFRDVVLPATRADMAGEADTIWIVSPPLSSRGWRRKGDDIDFQAARAGGKEPLDEITWIDEPIHPYAPWCWEDAAGRRTTDLSGYGETGDGTKLRMVPPPAVQVVAEALGFPDWRLLRPVVATWWT